MSLNKQTKSEIARINMRLPLLIKEKVERAATVRGLTLTDFATSVLGDSADEILAEHNARILSDRDRDIFLKMLDSDNEPNEALKDAFQTHKQLVAE